MKFLKLDVGVKGKDLRARRRRVFVAETPGSTFTQCGRALNPLIIAALPKYTARLTIPVWSHTRISDMNWSTGDMFYFGSNDGENNLYVRSELEYFLFLSKSLPLSSFETLILILVKAVLVYKIILDAVCSLT